ncbi:hypothetical protein AVEN_25738-1 [Araneus ventricosus]|uniref:Uncharacterized protein n=1 Tax=Araneus ventricosus TaxID=182803 RepID=A0A4Y2Q3N0_ARAVE|nr:hypothetical protein AVEN_25738-1 [Araneus ventricosus]
MFEYLQIGRKQQRGGQNVIGRLPVVRYTGYWEVLLRIYYCTKSRAIRFLMIFDCNGLKITLHFYKHGDVDFFKVTNNGMMLNDAAQFSISETSSCACCSAMILAALESGGQIYGCSIKFHFITHYSEKTGPHCTYRY